ncbi:MAG: TIR domain-containing protein, partial [Anaerolineae bacterium]|nr:TIR domain-containing protein [Anaerolineae bacterium]
MTDVFISYSRKDQDFVRRLYQRLSEQQRAAWVDWEEIPLTADWWQEITKGIDAADNFLFIISPDSVMSQICNREIEYAVTHNKRLIPIVRREALPEAMNKALARHNWLYAREHDDFDSVFEQLIEALDTDLDYVQGHTRLLVRAREWDSKARDASYLLRGSELSTAEGWLAQSGGKEPKPTALQTQYILASRRASTTRQRTLLAGVSTALAITVGLAIVAAALFGVAENRRQESDLRGTEVAFSAATAVAAEATSARRAVEWQGLAWAVASERAGAADDHDLELALALQAMTVVDPPPEVTGQMFDAAYAPGAARVFAGAHTGWVAGLAVSHDGRRLLTSGTEGGLALWDAATGELIRSETFGTTVERLGVQINVNAINAAAFHPTRPNIAVTGSADGKVTLWDVDAWQPLAQASAGFVGSIAFSPDGSQVAVGLTRGGENLQIFDGESLKQLRGLEGHSTDVVALAFSPDGALLLSGSDDATAILWDAASGERIMTYGPIVDPIEPNIAVVGVGFGIDAPGAAPTVLLATNSGQILRLMRETGAEMLRFDVGRTPSTLNTIVVSPDGYTVAAAENNGNASLWDGRSGRRLRIFRGGGLYPLTNAAFSPDGLSLYTGARDGSARRWFVRSGAEAARYTLFNNGAGAAALTFSPDGRRALLGGGADDPALAVWNLETDQPEHHLEGHADAIIDIETQIDADGRLIALSAGWDRLLRMWDIDAGAALRTYDLGAILIPTLDLHSDGRRALVSVYGADPRAGVLDLETGEMTQRYDLGLGVYVVSLYSPDEAQVFIGGATVDGIAGGALLDAATGETLITFDALVASAVNSAVFSADGTRLLIGTQDGQIVEYALPGGGEVRRYVGHTDTIAGMTFSPDGRWMLSAGYDDSVRVWDAATGALLFTLAMDDDGRGVGFAPDGRLFTVSRDGGLTEWRLASDA